MRKVCVVITARPSYSRIRSALTAIRRHPGLELQLVVAASALLERYGNVIRNIEKDGFDIAARVYMVLEGENLPAMAKTTGIGLLEIATVLDNLKPDIVVTIADRYETLATAIAAAYMNIPLCHIQGGEVTGSIDEKVRHAVTKLSDLHFVATSESAQRVIRMGEDPASVFVTGCPSIDLAVTVRDEEGLDFDPFEKYGGVGEKVDLSGGYLVVVQHPVTTEYELARHHVTETLHAVCEIDLPALWFWPNVDAGSDGTSHGIRQFREIEKPKKIHFFKNIDSFDFLRIINNCKCLLGNSSVAIREGSFLGIAAVNIGSRQNGRERGPNVIDVGYDRRSIAEAVVQHIANGRYPMQKIYGDGRAGGKIADLLIRVPLKIEKMLNFADSY